MKVCSGVLGALFFLLFQAGLVLAGDVVAVLSSDSGPYREAFEGFQEAMGRPIPSVNLDNVKDLDIPRDVKVVVAFGSKAALRRYPSHVTLVYCMAPGTEIDPKVRRGSSVKVHMQPRPDVIARQLKEIQPPLKRLAIFYRSSLFEENLMDIQRAFSQLGIHVRLEKLETDQEIPERLRAIQGRVEALWLPPDPPLITAQSFTVFKEFCWANSIPFYAPTAGLTKLGAAVSISSSFKEIGRSAGKATQQVLNNKPLQDAYPEEVEVTINQTAAGKSGLLVPPAVLKKATRVLP